MVVSTAQALTPWTLTPWSLSINTNNVVVVTNSTFGAVGDGVFTNTAAFQNAINTAAGGGLTNGLRGGMVEIPPGTYLCGPLTMKSNVRLQIDSNAVVRLLPYGTWPGSPYTGNVSPFVNGSYLTNIAITGLGMIDGQGSPWWQAYESFGINRPVIINLPHCSEVLLQDFTSTNPPAAHIVVKGANAGNINVVGVKLFAPDSAAAVNPSHNTDGVDFAETNALFRGCVISTGDDDIAMGSSGSKTSDILVTNCTFGNGHGCSIGSHTSGGVSNITVINCSFTGTQSGFKVKSERGRGGLVRNIKYLNLTMTNVDWPVSFDSHYEFGLGTHTTLTPAFVANNAYTNPASLNSTTPVIQDILVSNVTATVPNGRPPLQIWALPEAPASNIVFRDMHIISSSTRVVGIYLATNIEFINCSISTPPGVDSAEFWSTGLIFTNSSAPGDLWSFDGLTTNGVGNSLAFYNAQGTLKNTNAFGSGPLSLSTSTFTVSNDLTLFPNTVLNFILGSNPATLEVRGNLTLGGTVNLSAGAGFTTGTYTLLTYTGALSGNLPTLGTVPAGYTYSFNTNTTGQVKLTVAAIATQPPSVPTNLVATVGCNSVTLTWSPSSTATAYNIERALVSGGESATNAIVATTNYTDTQVTNGTMYYYVVSAVNGFGESPDSAQVSAMPEAPTYIVVTTNVFSDDFTGSWLNSTSPEAPTSTSTSYEVISSKGWNPTPFLSAGHLKFGISPTTSGVIEMQARFTDPVTLATVGDSVSLVVSFTNTAGLLTGSGAMGFGLYQSGQNFPVPGGLNGTATTSYSDHSTGNAQTWIGYVGQIAFTGDSSRIMTRPAQTIGTLYNNDQDLVTSGSGSSSYDCPTATTVGSASTAASVTLMAGNPYTETLTITLTAPNTLAITNSLYSGTDTNGTLLSQCGGTASGSTYLTDSFDALAVGWRETGDENTAIDINSIIVNSTLTEAVTPPPSLTPTNLFYQINGNQLQLSWPADHRGWYLEVQTNSLKAGLGTNWDLVAGSDLTNQETIPLDPTNPCTFFRLVYP